MRDSLLAFIRETIHRMATEDYRALFTMLDGPDLSKGTRRMTFGYGYFDTDKVQCEENPADAMRSEIFYLSPEEAVDWFLKK